MNKLLLLLSLALALAVVQAFVPPKIPTRLSQTLTIRGGGDDDDEKWSDLKLEQVVPLAATLPVIYFAIDTMAGNAVESYFDEDKKPASPREKTLSIAAGSSMLLNAVFMGGIAIKGSDKLLKITNGALLGGCLLEQGLCELANRSEEVSGFDSKYHAVFTGIRAICVLGAALALRSLYNDEEG